MNDKIFITWKHYIDLCDKLVDKLKEKEFDFIIGVARGGLIPAQYIAYQCNIDKVYSFGMRTYNDNDVKNAQEIYQNIEDINPSARILLVDDICDTGDTLYYIRNRYYWHDITIATLQYKQNGLIVPDHYVEEVDRGQWIVYPYDK